MHMKRFVILLTLLGLSTTLHAQKIVPPLPADVLARVGSTVITGRDLIERIELMPWPEKEKPKEHDSSIVKALNSLVAERLLAMEGRLRNVGSDEMKQQKLHAMEKLFVRDELYKRQVKQKITVSEKEIWNGLAKFAWQLHVIALPCKDRAAADSLYHRLQRTSSLANVLNHYPPQFVAAVETLQVNFGGLDTVFENTVYAIGKKKFTAPFQCPTYGWTVAVLMDRGTNPVAEKMSEGDRRYRVDEMIRLKKEGPVGRRFIASVLVSQKANVDSVLFETLAGALHAIIARDSTQHKKNGLFITSSEDIDELLTVLQKDAHAPFVRMQDAPLTLADGIEGLRHLRLGFPSLELRQFKNTFNGQIRFVVETELLAREGYRQNLQYSEPVRHDVDMWANYWASRYLMWNVDDTVHVSADDVLAALDKAAADIGLGYEVNIQEVLCDSLGTAARVLDDYAHGTPLAQLVQSHSKRPDWKDHDGVSGYMTLAVHPELTHRAFLAKTGSIVGPVKVKNGYSIFTVLGKRKTGVGNLPEVDSVIAAITDNLTAGKRRQTMNGYVAGLAKNYSVDINYDKLAAINIQPANMFTRRHIGFGGIVTATPILYPNWEWVKEYRDGGHIIP
jgi:hypothetical protein